MHGSDFSVLVAADLRLILKNGKRETLHKQRLQIQEYDET